MIIPSTSKLISYNFNIDTISAVNKNTPQNKMRNSIIHDLAKQGDVLGTEIMFERGHYIDLKNEIGKTPLHIAAFFGHIDIVRFLVENGADINKEIESSGQTALYMAVLQNHYQIIRYLIKNGAFVNVTDKITGKTLLHIAAKKGDVQMTGILISAKINVLINNKRGMTARDIAAMNNNKILEKILLKTMEHHARGRTIPGV